jgi:cell division protein FtsZ
VAQAAEPQSPRPRLVAVSGGAPVPLPVAGHQPAAMAQPMPIGTQGQAGSLVPQARNMDVQHLESAVPGAFAAGELQTQAAPPPSSHPPRSSLFTEPHRMAAAPTQATVHRPSIFGRVTGGWRKPADAEAIRTEPQIAETEPSAVVRQAGPEPEVQGLDIPAFLRRQSN